MWCELIEQIWPLLSYLLTTANDEVIICALTKSNKNLINTWNRTSEAPDVLHDWTGSIVAVSRDQWIGDCEASLRVLDHTIWTHHTTHSTTTPLAAHRTVQVSGVKKLMWEVTKLGHILRSTSVKNKHVIFGFWMAEFKQTTWSQMLRFRR